MKKFERLGDAVAPDGTTLTLYRHDVDYSIRVNGVELMSTRRHESEDRLADVVCAPLADRPAARVLVGGLGLGFTLKRALELLASDARVVVAELLANVIAWNTNAAYPLAHEALHDPRVTSRHIDVAQVLREHVGAFDGIMLDVDNGAASLTTKGNARLYQDAGIRTAAAALSPGGLLAYWSADEDANFLRALRRCEMQVDITRVRTHATSQTWHTIYVARRVEPKAAKDASIHGRHPGDSRDLEGDSRPTHERS